MRVFFRIVVCLTLIVLYMAVFQWEDMERWMHARATPPVDTQDIQVLPEGHPSIEFQHEGVRPICPMGYTEEDAAGNFHVSDSHSTTCMQLYNRGWYSAFLYCAIGWS